MLDVVVNNMAYIGSPESVDWGSIQPLSKEEDYHAYCPIDYTNRTSTLYVSPPHLTLTQNSVGWETISSPSPTSTLKAHPSNKP